jgi:hypothetical protein
VPEWWKVIAVTKSPLLPEDLKQGDLIKVTQVFRVLTGVLYGEYSLVDEKNPSEIHHYEVGAWDQNTTRKIELLHREKPKPERGDVITGKDVNEIRWKCGAVLRDALGVVYLLSREGEWIDSEGCYVGFDRFAGSIKFDVINVVQ